MDFFVHGLLKGNLSIKFAVMDFIVREDLKKKKKKNKNGERRFPRKIKTCYSYIISRDLVQYEIFHAKFCNF